MQKMLDPKTEADLLRELLRQMKEEIPMSTGTDEFGYWVIVPHPIGWAILADRRSHKEMMDWCAEHFTEKSYYHDRDTWCYHFKNDGDRVAFILRWCK